MPLIGIATGVVADGKQRKSDAEELPMAILSRLPVEMEQGMMSEVPFRELVNDDSDDSDDGEFVPSLMRLKDPSPVFYTSSHLPSLAPEHIPIWKALHQFGPNHQDYAAAFAQVERTAPHPLSHAASSSGCPVSSNDHAIHLIRTVFNYSSISVPATTPDNTYYGIVFRSTRHCSAPSKLIRALYATDRHAHEESTRSGGLLMYWYGIPNDAGENVTTCLWTSRDDAVTASQLPRHRTAAGLASTVYQNYDVMRYLLRVDGGRMGIEAWK
jgi:hypothetical protein